MEVPVRRGFNFPSIPKVRSVDPADYDSEGFDTDGYDKEGHHRYDSNYYFSRPWYYCENNNLEEDWTVEEEENEDDQGGLVLVEQWDNGNEVDKDDENADEQVGIVLAENWDPCSFEYFMTEDFDLDIPVKIPWVIEDSEEADDEDEGHGIHILITTGRTVYVPIG